jgi:hypothetical protein
MEFPIASFLLVTEIEIYESARGFIARAAERNHSFLKVRKSISSHQSIQNDMHLMSSLTETSSEALRAHGSLVGALAGKPKEFRIGSEQFPMSLIYASSNRVCPHCYKADGISRIYWDLRSYTVCHIHRCKLISRCTDCDRDIGWDHGHRKCRCGQKIEAMQTSAVSSTVERDHCGLLALATMHSLRSWRTPADAPLQTLHDRRISLHWHFLLIEFLEHVLLPGFAEEFDIANERLNRGTVTWLMLKILEDQRYCLQIREAMFLHAASSPFTLGKAIRLNKTPEESRQLLKGCLEDLPFHRILWDWKNGTGLSASDLAAMAEIPGPVELRREKPAPALRPKAERYRPRQQRINLGMVGTTHGFSSW